MFGLSVVTIGCDPATQGELDEELRVAEVTWEADFADFEAAISACQGDLATPRLLVLPFTGPEQAGLIRQLIETIPDWPILVLIPDEDGQHQFETGQKGLKLAMRSGASQVVSQPLQREDFQAALKVIGQRSCSRAAAKVTAPASALGSPASSVSKTGWVIAVAGVTGGCGATTLAMNLADHLNRQDEQSRVAIVDLSLRMGVIALNLSIEPTYTILDLLPYAENLDETMVRSALTPVDNGLYLLAGPHFSVSATPTTHEQILAILEVVREQCNLVVVDTPCTFDELYFQVLQYADAALLVGEQKVHSIRALKMVTEIVSGLGRDHLEPQVIQLVINRYDPRMGGFGLHRLKDVLDRQSVLTVANDYPAASAALNVGRMVRRQDPRSKILADLEIIARAVIGSQSKLIGSVGENGPEPKSKFFAKLRQTLRGQAG